MAFGELQLVEIDHRRPDFVRDDGLNAGAFGAEPNQPRQVVMQSKWTEKPEID
jgi:hypothetical protein